MKSGLAAIAPRRPLPPDPEQEPRRSPGGSTEREARRGGRRLFAARAGQRAPGDRGPRGTFGFPGHPPRPRSRAAGTSAVSFEIAVPFRDCNEPITNIVDSAREALHGTERQLARELALGAMMDGHQ